MNLSPTDTGSRTAAVLTVGSELTEGLRDDTNAAEVALALSSAGHAVRELASVPDDVAAVRASIARLTAAYDTVVVTGGLGPTHDDVTREAAAAALDVELVEEPALREALLPAAAAHERPEAAEQVYRQALVLPGAEVLPPTIGTAPGLIASQDRHTLVLLPGPPAEMRPMLARLVERFDRTRTAPVALPCAGISESDAQVIASGALDSDVGVTLTVLSRPGEVEILLLDDGAGAAALAESASRVRDALGHACYAEDGRTLPEAVLALAARRGVSLATAESCTGGMVAAEITSVPGSSASFLGGVVCYSDASKRSLLGVPRATITGYGAVSAETAAAMAEGARAALGAEVAVSVTGVAGPAGGTADKPVGLVYVCLAEANGTHVERRTFGGDRAIVRRRATVAALDMLRRRLAGFPLLGG